MTKNWPDWTPKHTFQLPNYRVHLSVTDWTMCPAPNAVGAENQGKIQFSVGVLPATAHINSSYSGHSVYFGESLHAALQYAADRTGVQAIHLRTLLPAKFHKYLYPTRGAK